MPPELRESSGLAVSRAHPGVLWSHNDSGDGPWIYQMDTTAALTGKLRISDARAVDWEAMDIGPCPRPPGEAPLRPAEDGDGGTAASVPQCIYVADVGDNGLRRDTLTVYVVAEPEWESGSDAVESLGRFRYRYPGGRHDVEAFAVAPDGDLVIVTKGRTPDILLFHVPAAQVAGALHADEVVQLPGGVRLPIEPDWDVGRATTGASVSPDGTALAVRTSSEIYFYRWPVGATPEEAAPPCLLGDQEPQGEAVSFWSDGRILLTSETWSRRPGHLLAVRCPGVEAGWQND
jgi:hypothetical protein